MPRRPLIVGNWKMNLNLPQVRALITGIREGLAGIENHDRIDLAVCPPATYLFPAAKALDGSRIALGAQNVYHETAGAFTGELSAAMIAETGAKFVIIGHSERRHTIGHHEDDAMIHRKLRALLGAKLTPILCVGETLAERDANQTLDVLTYQVIAGLGAQSIDSAERLVVAYEPVWAIGTGRNATAAQAQEAHAHIRTVLTRIVGPIAAGVRILYGGSLKPENAEELMRLPDVDGGLVGGASLKPESFLGIIRGALVGKG